MTIPLAAESAVYDCIVCLSSGDALTFITAMKTQSKHSGSALLALLESEFGSSTEANQLAVQAQLHAVAFSGDLKDYLLRLDLLRRKLTGSFVLPYSTLLHIVKNACIHTFQMEIKQADKLANKNFDAFLTEMRATAQDLATYAKPNSAKAFAATVTTGASTTSTGCSKSPSSPSGTDCFYCKKPGHSLEKCRIMLASRRDFQGQQSQRRKDAAQQKVVRLAFSDDLTSTGVIDRRVYDEFIASKLFASRRDLPTNLRRRLCTLPLRPQALVP